MKFISDLQKGTKVKLVCTYGNKRVAFDNEVKDIVNRPEIGAKGVVTDLIKVDGKWVSFKGFPLSLEAYLNQRLCRFKIDNVIYDVRKGRLVLFSKQFVQRINKRRAQRFDCDFVTDLFVNNHSYRAKCVDISTVGARVACMDVRGSIHIGDLVDAYIHTSKGKQSIGVKGNIVRVVHDKHNKPVEFGVNFSHADEEVVTLVNSLRNK